MRKVIGQFSRIIVFSEIQNFFLDGVEVLLENGFKLCPFFFALFFCHFNLIPTLT